MPKDLLEKFDKQFDELIVFQTYEIPMIVKDDAKSLAHSHLEAAYEAGKNENTRCAGCDKCLSRPGIITGEMCVAKYDCDCHHPFSQQSNLERLIEKLPKTIELKDSAEGFGRFALLWDEKGWRAGYNEMLPYEGEFLTKECFGSTPTEAVENLIKALEKK